MIVLNRFVYCVMILRNEALVYEAWVDFFKIFGVFVIQVGRQNVCFEIWNKNFLKIQIQCILFRNIPLNELLSSMEIAQQRIKKNKHDILF